MGVTVSVIITTKNRVEFLKRAVESVLQQTFKDFEIIVVDDASTDETLSYIEESRRFIENFKFISNKVSLGGSGARNKGLNIAVGEYVAFLDDDDEWLPEKLENQVRILATSKDLIGVSCSYSVYYRNEFLTNIIKKEKSYDYHEMLQGDNVVGGCSFVLVKKVKGITFDEKLKACQDWDYWLQLSKETKKKFYLSSSILVKYNKHDLENISDNFKNKIKGDIAFLFKYRKDITPFGYLRKGMIYKNWVTLFLRRVKKKLEA